VDIVLRDVVEVIAVGYGGGEGGIHFDRGGRGWALCLGSFELQEE
jgi:hypothetical protein